MYECRSNSLRREQHSEMKSLSEISIKPWLPEGGVTETTRAIFPPDDTDHENDIIRNKFGLRQNY
jgi:hypothetical protein